MPRTMFKKYGTQLTFGLISSQFKLLHLIIESSVVPNLGIRPIVDIILSYFKPLYLITVSLVAPSHYSLDSNLFEISTIVNSVVPIYRVQSTSGIILSYFNFLQVIIPNTDVLIQPTVVLIHDLTAVKTNSSDEILDD